MTSATNDKANGPSGPPVAWRSSAADIMKHPCLCIATLCMPPTTYYRISERIDDVPAEAWQALFGGYCCCLGFMIRTRLRRKYNLKGNVALDLCAHCFCHCFALQHDFIEAKCWAEDRAGASTSSGVPSGMPPHQSVGHPADMVPFQGAVQGLPTRPMLVPQDSAHSQVSSSGPQVPPSTLENRFSRLTDALPTHSVELSRQQLPPGARSGDSATSQGRQEKIDGVIMNAEAIDAMRDELVDDLDGGGEAPHAAAPSANAPGSRPIAVPPPLPLHHLQPPMYQPPLGMQEPVSASDSDRSLISGRGNVVQVGTLAGPPMQLSVGDARGLQVSQLHTTTPRGQVYGQVPHVIPPEYPGSGNYSSQGSSRRFTGTGSGHYYQGMGR